MSSSTTTYSGFTDNKSSSRILQPPGGGCSNIFGVDEPVKANGANGDTKTVTKTNIFGVEEIVRVVKVVEEEKEDKENGDKVEEKKVEKPAAGEVISKPVYNPITGEEIKPVRSSTRVKQPPGGVSTKLW